MKNSSKAFAFSLLFLASSSLLILATPALAYHSKYSYKPTVSKGSTNHIPVLSTSKTSKKSTHATSTPVTKPPVTKPVVPPVSLPTIPVLPAAGEVRATAYITGYGWPDNTPAGAAISDGVLHKTAGGVGTYADPITVAVGHSIIGGKDILDYPAGTKFYIPNLRKYFIAEDTCGDGNSPQNGACHTGYPKGTSMWLDIWVGGQGGGKSAVMACEDAITDSHAVIVNPASNYAVVSGAVYATSCAQQYGETPVTQ